MKCKMEEKDFPALYKAADSASLNAQSNYFNALRCYLLLLVTAALISFIFSKEGYGAITSVALFLITLGILVWIKMKKPEDIWYNGRAVAESVKTRTWRWMMKAEPYDKAINDEQAQRELLSDLKEILHQNRSLSGCLEWTPDLGETISDKMMSIRNLPWQDRLDIYKNDRVDDQSIWYSKKSLFNKRRTRQWFAVSILFHAIAIFMLLYRIQEPTSSLPIGVVAAAASAVLTWAQAKKHNELNASYALAAHEIVIIKGEAVSVKNEKHLSEFVINSESAFSREHIQWVARKSI